MKTLEKVLSLVLALALQITLLGVVFVGVNIYGGGIPFSKVWSCALIFMAFIIEVWYILTYVQDYNLKKEIEEIRGRYIR